MLILVPDRPAVRARRGAALAARPRRGSPRRSSGWRRAGVELADGVRAEAEARSRARRQVIAAAARQDRRQRARTPGRARAPAHRALGNHLTGWLRDGIAGRRAGRPSPARAAAARRRSPAEASGPDGVRGERFGGTLVVRAWQRLAGRLGVLVGEALPEALVRAQARLAAGGVAYEHLKMERPTITATMVLGFGGLALLVAFAAIWLGLHLSRRFTAPLLALVGDDAAGGRRRVLEQVPLPAEDEVGMLVGSFNSMVLRLRERDEELQATVRRLDTVLGAVRTGVLTLDAERQTVRGNPAAAAMLGVPELATSGDAARGARRGGARTPGRDDPDRRRLGRGDRSPSTRAAWPGTSRWRWCRSGGPSSRRGGWWRSRT